MDYERRMTADRDKTGRRRERDEGEEGQRRGMSNKQLKENREYRDGGREEAGKAEDRK